MQLASLRIRCSHFYTILLLNSLFVLTAIFHEASLEQWAERKERIIIAILCLIIRQFDNFFMAGKCFCQKV